MLAAVEAAIESAPLFQPRMPRTGKPFSVRMTNCGALGWVSDQERGYRYQAEHPETGRPWPAIPALALRAWEELGDYPHAPEACLVNLYGPEAAHGAASGPRRGGFDGARCFLVAGSVLHLPLGADAERQDTIFGACVGRCSGPRAGRRASPIMASREFCPPRPFCLTAPRQSHATARDEASNVISAGAIRPTSGSRREAFNNANLNDAGTAREE